MKGLLVLKLLYDPCNARILKPPKHSLETCRSSSISRIFGNYRCKWSAQINRDTHILGVSGKSSKVVRRQCRYQSRPCQLAKPQQASRHHRLGPTPMVRPQQRPPTFMILPEKLVRKAARCPPTMLAQRKIMVASQHNWPDNIPGTIRRARNRHKSGWGG